MADDLQTSAQTDKRNTRSTKSLTPADLLTILQQAAANCQQVGIKVQVGYLYRNGVPTTVITLENVAVIDGNLIAINGKDVPA